MFQVIPAILLLGFRIAAVVFLIIFPIARNGLLLFSKPWIVDPLWQGIRYILMPLAYLENKNHVLLLQSKADQFLLVDEQEADLVVEIKDDINDATLAALSRVEGVGIKKAQEILEYRTQCGGFRRMEELSLIKGIGQKTFLILCDRFEVKAA